MRKMFKPDLRLARSRVLPSLRLPVGVIAGLFLACASAGAGETSWATGSTNFFDVAASWSAGAPAPDGTDRIRFDVAGTYDVRVDSFTSIVYGGPPHVQQVDVAQGQVSLITYQDAPNRRALIVDGPGGSGDVVVSGGALHLGAAGNADNRFELAAGRDVLLDAGALRVRDGSHLAIGRNLGVGTAGGAAELLISGVDASLTQSGAAVTTVGHGTGGAATLSIDGGGSFTAPDATVTIQTTGTVNLLDGTLVAGAINHTNGGSFVFTGGSLGVHSFQGSLAQDGGQFEPGGGATVSGDYTLSAGAVRLSIGGPVRGVDYSFLDVAGDLNLLGGTLDLSITLASLSPGQVFDIIDVGQILTGAFSGLSEGAVVASIDGTDLRISYAAGDGNDIALYTDALAVPGDADGDGDVDGDDFNAWGGNFPTASGATLAQGDFDGDGDVDGDDFNTWGGNFPYPAPAVSNAAPATRVVPEPAAFLLVGLGALCLLRRSK